MEKYKLAYPGKVKVINTKKELESFGPALNLDPNNIFRTYVAVLDADRASYVISLDEKKPLEYINIKKFAETGVSLVKSYKKGDYNLIKLPPLKTWMKNHLGCEYNKEDVVNLLKPEMYWTDGDRISPIPQVFYSITNKTQTGTKYLARPEAVVHLMGEKQEEILGRGKVTYSKLEFEDKTLRMLALAYPELLASKLESLTQINKLIEPDSVVNLASDKVIKPLTDTTNLTNLKLIYASSKTPKATELSQGDYKFLIGNLLDSEIQVLAEYSSGIDLQYYLDRIDTDPDCYRLFVYPESMAPNFKGFYRNENTFKLYKNSFEGFNIKDEYEVRPIKELPVPSDIVKEGTGVIAAIKYYLKTGKAISYVHFRG